MTDDDSQTIDRRTVLGITGLGILGLGSVFGSTAGAQEDNGNETATPTETEDGTASSGYDVEEVIDDWPEKQTQTVREMMDKYGDPDEVVPSRIIWHQKDDDSPWKHTIVYRDAVQHNFPVQHPDFLEQAIELYIPPHHYDKVAKFDGSVILERTKGMVMARCDQEPMNYLAINLAHAIAFKGMSVEEARRAYAEDAMAFMNGDEPERTQGFQFEMPKDEERDPDTTVIHDGEIEMDQAIGEATAHDHGKQNETTDQQTDDGSN